MSLVSQFILFDIGSFSRGLCLTEDVGEPLSSAGGTDAAYYMERLKQLRAKIGLDSRPAETKVCKKIYSQLLLVEHSYTLRL